MLGWQSMADKIVALVKALPAHIVVKFLACVGLIRNSVIGADDNRLAAWIAPERLLDPHRWRAIARPRRAGTRGHVQQREGGEAVPAVKNGAKALRRERREPLADARVVEEGVR